MRFFNSDMEGGGLVGSNKEIFNKLVECLTVGLGGKKADSVNGNVLVFNFGYKVHNLARYQVSDGKNIVKTEIVVIDENTIQVKEDISHLDQRSIYLSACPVDCWEYKDEMLQNQTIGFTLYNDPTYGEVLRFYLKKTNRYSTLNSFKYTMGRFHFFADEESVIIRIPSESVNGGKMFLFVKLIDQTYAMTNTYSNSIGYFYVCSGETGIFEKTLVCLNTFHNSFGYGNSATNHVSFCSVFMNNINVPKIFQVIGSFAASGRNKAYYSGDSAFYICDIQDSYYFAVEVK